MARDGLKIAVRGVDDLRVVRGNGGADAHPRPRRREGPEPLDLGVHRARKGSATGQAARPGPSGAAVPLSHRQAAPQQARRRPELQRAQARHVGHPRGQAERELHRAVVHPQRPVFPFHRNKSCASATGAGRQPQRRAVAAQVMAVLPRTQLSIRRRSPPVAARRSAVAQALGAQTHHPSLRTAPSPGSIPAPDPFTIALSEPERIALDPPFLGASGSVRPNGSIRA